MDTAVGYVLVLGATLLIRQVIVGRVAETPQDIKDLFLALVNGDTSAAANVLSQRGNNVDGSGDLTGTIGNGLSDAIAGASDSSTPLLSTMKTLGNNAKGYQLGATGPNYYDCSGLVWRAMYTTGLYKGPRFTTRSFDSIATRFATQVKSPQVGDIVIWPAKHMGIVDGSDSMYSARSVSKGIGSGSLSADVKYFGSTPEYWRLNESVSSPIAPGARGE